MANNCKQCFNAHYQPHCHPTTNSLWLCSSVHCGPPHQSRRIWLSAEADNQKCTLFHCCFDHYRILAYKISVCEVCIIWRKATEAFKNLSPIAESRTGKPAMVALKIQLDCSRVRDMTVWANIFVHSHLGCGTDFVFILFCKSHTYFRDAKAMQINKILKISLIWHVKLNQPPKQ